MKEATIPFYPLKLFPYFSPLFSRYCKRSPNKSAALKSMKAEEQIEYLTISICRKCVTNRTQTTGINDLKKKWNN